MCLLFLVVVVVRCFCCSTNLYFFPYLFDVDVSFCCLILPSHHPALAALVPCPVCTRVCVYVCMCVSVCLCRRPASGAGGYGDNAALPCCLPRPAFVRTSHRFLLLQTARPTTHPLLPLPLSVAPGWVGVNSACRAHNAAYCCTIVPLP